MRHRRGDDVQGCTNVARGMEPRETIPANWLLHQAGDFITKTTISDRYQTP